MSPVLVTGGSGYVGTQVIMALLDSGREVRATVRTPAAKAKLSALIRRRRPDDEGLEIVLADLSSDDGWAQAVAGCEEIHHVASPNPIPQPEDPDELIRPAKEGTLRVLSAARTAGARRVVLTSSFAAIGSTPKPVPDYTEADWTDPEMPGLAPYPKSKTIAERAAWDFIEREGGDTELVVVNPTFIFGPTLVSELHSSTTYMKMILTGEMSVAPRQSFGVVDVRDVADLHLRAMATPEAAGKRYVAVADGPTITWLDLAQTLRREFPVSGRNAPTAEAPGEELPQIVIHNDRAKTELGWEPRPVHKTIIDTVNSMDWLSLLDSES